MARVVVLDSGPLGLAARPRGEPPADRCRGWLRALDAAGAVVVAPEVADYEVRRELLRCGATAGIVRLDRLTAGLVYEPITTPAMRLAADFWAHVRRAGRPTAGPRALDVDAILAAQASLLAGPGDSVLIATTNVGHLSRFPGIVAEEWEKVAP